MTVLKCSTTLHGEPLTIELSAESNLELVKLLANGVNVAVTLEKRDGKQFRYELTEHEHTWTEWVPPNGTWTVWWRKCPPCDLEETSEVDPCLSPSS